MKTNEKMTRYELATLASRLPGGTAQERVRLAAEIWMETSTMAKIEINIRRDRLDKMEENLNKTASLLPLSKALEILLPDHHRHLRFDLWKQFRAWQAANVIDAPTVESDEKNGVPYRPALHDEIKAWQAATKAGRLSDRAKNAANARWEKDRVGTPRERKAGGKTRQVKKKSKS